MDLSNLISQLEEPKFLRLFRHLVDHPDHRLNTSQPACPVGLDGAELWVKQVRQVGSLGAWAESWAFQIAHLPAGLWSQPSISQFLDLRIAAAVRALSELDEPRPLLFVHQASESDRFEDHPATCTYHLVTNIAQGLEERVVTGITTKLRSAFESQLGSLARDMHFGLGTPETIIGGAYRAGAEALIVDLLNMPSSYYLLAREGEIVVGAATEHGSFYTAAPGQKAQGATSTSTLSKAHVAWSRGLTDLQGLIDSPTTREADLQKFFEEFPQFLFALDERYCEVKSQVCLYDGQGTSLIPDFLVRLEGTPRWDAIELKRPQHTISVGDGGRKAAKAAAQAIGQLLTYRDHFGTAENRQRAARQLGTAPYEPGLIVVIGRGTPGSRFRWRSARPGIPPADIVTYDYLFERARESARALGASSARTEIEPGRRTVLEPGARHLC